MRSPRRVLLLISVEIGVVAEVMDGVAARCGRKIQDARSGCEGLGPLPAASDFAGHGQLSAVQSSLRRGRIRSESRQGAAPRTLPNERTCETGLLRDLGRHVRSSSICGRDAMARSRPRVPRVKGQPLALTFFARVSRSSAAPRPWLTSPRPTANSGLTASGPSPGGSGGV